jgi:hypothetical protein
LDKVSQAAEQVATSASRREFLGQFGRGAMVLAAALGGLLAFPGGVTAGKPCSSNADCKNGQVCLNGSCGNAPQACGSGGALDCTYQLTGDACYIDGVAGHCQYDNTDLTPANACECVVRGKKNPR